MRNLSFARRCRRAVRGRATLSLLTTHYLLLTTCYLLLTTYYLLLTTCYLLLATYCSLLATCYLLLATSYLLLTAHYLLLATYYLLLTTYYLRLLRRVSVRGVAAAPLCGRERPLAPRPHRAARCRKGRPAAGRICSYIVVTKSLHRRCVRNDSDPGQLSTKAAACRGTSVSHAYDACTT